VKPRFEQAVGDSTPMDREVVRQNRMSYYHYYHLRAAHLTFGLQESLKEQNFGWSY
jgi:hypothetical protein